MWRRLAVGLTILVGTAIAIFWSGRAPDFISLAEPADPIVASLPSPVAPPPAPAEAVGPALDSSLFVSRDTIHPARSEASPAVSGRVLDPDSGVGVAGIAVEFASGEKAPIVRTVTAGDGTFRFDLSNAQIDAFAPDRASCEVRICRAAWVSTKVYLTPNQVAEGSEVTLYAAPSGGVVARVRDAAGAPVEVLVAMIDPGLETSAPSERPIDCRLAEQGTPVMTKFGSADFRASSNPGEFELLGLVHGRSARLRLFLLDDRRYVVGVSPLERCGEIRSVEIVIPPLESRITGILTRQGQVYAGTVTWQGPRLAGSAKADDDGRFELRGVEPGLVKLSARDGRTTRQVEAVVDVPGNLTIERNLDIPSSDVLRGVVRNAGSSKLRVLATARYGIDPEWWKAKGERTREPLPVPKPDAVADVAPDGSFELRVRDTGTDYVLEIESRTPREFGPEPRGYAIATPGDMQIVLDAVARVAK